jgi:glycosyltransferase involved in cell wall biosynthesis
MPRVSLIVTAYNAQNYLAHSICSVLKQTYRDWELIILNDGSEDNTQEIAVKFWENHRQIKVLSGRHRGQAMTNHIAHQFTNGELIGWLDADDTLHPQCLEKCIQAFDELNLQILYTQYQTIDRYGSLKQLGKRCLIPYSRERLLFDFMTFHFRLYRYDLFLKIGGIDTSFVRAFDYDFCLRASEVTDFYHLKEPLYYYRQHPDSLSAKNQQLQQEYAAIAINKACARRGIERQVTAKDGKIYLLERG